MSVLEASVKSIKAFSYFFKGMGYGDRGDWKDPYIGKRDDAPYFAKD